MSHTRHTPGPWEVHGRGWVVPTHGDRVKNSYPVATCYGHPDCEANAHLIAAAPELVAALEKIAAFAPGNGDVCEVIARIARAALAKAKGE